MKTVYRNDVFRREDTGFIGDVIRSVGEKPTPNARVMTVTPVLGRHTPAPAPKPLGMRNSGERMGDLVDDMKVQVDALLKDLDGLLAAVPVEAAGPFKARRDACLAMDSIAKYKCLYDLYGDIKKALNNTAVIPYPAPKPAPDNTWMWVGIASAGALALVAIVSLARR